MFSSFCIRGCITLGAALLLASPLAAEGVDAGLLGKSYLGASVFLEHVRTLDISDGNGFAVGGNVPLTPQLDLGASASYESFSDFKIRDKRLGVYLRGYADTNGFRPFVDIGVGGTWQSSDVFGIHYSSNDGIYAVGVGVEAPVARSTALFVRAGYNKYFDSSNGHYWLYTVGLNHWITKRLNAGVSVNFQDNDSIVYMLALNFGL